MWLARNRRPAGRQRIARIFKQVLDRATLTGSDRPPWSFWKHVALHVTVVSRIGIDDATDGAVILRHFRFHAAKGVAVTHDHDLAFHVNAGFLEIFVVVGQTVVRIDHWTSNVARR